MLFFLKDNKKEFILWLNVPKVTAYKQYSSFEWRQVQSDTAMGNKNGGLNQQVIASCPPAVPSRTIWRGL